MKILIDARFLGPEGTGVGKYVDKLLANLSEIDQENKYVVLLKKTNFHLFNPTKGNFKKVLVDAHWYTPKEQILVPAVIFREKPDLVHFPHFNVPLAWKGKFLVTIHDLTISKHGRSLSRSRFYPAYVAKRLMYNLTLKKALGSSAKIFTPSNFVKKDLVKRFRLSKDKIIVTYEAADEIFVNYGSKEISEGEEKKIYATYGIKKPYIITVGVPFPYKNIEKVLEALAIFSKNLNLVHVSARNKFSEGLKEVSVKLGVDSRFIQTGYTTSDDLAVLYKGAVALIFPSLSEGFGLPGLEAMAVGCPVICSDIEVFKEVYDEAALYFSPHSVGDLSDKIKKLLSERKVRSDLVKKGFEQTKKYSWKKLANQTLETYNSLGGFPN